MSDATFVSLRTWEYRDTSVPTPPAPPLVKRSEPVQPAAAPVATFTDEQVAARIGMALAEAEKRWSVEAQAREAAHSTSMQANLQRFAEERSQYFRRAEREVVELALAVARKVIQREAALDPDLLAGLVRIALDNLGAGSRVRVRVASTDLVQWQQNTRHRAGPYTFEVEADPELAAGDCLVETDLGTAHFGFEAQLKNIERGVLDLLEARPKGTAAADTDLGQGASQAGGQA